MEGGSKCDGYGEEKRLIPRRMWIWWWREWEMVRWNARMC